MKLRSALLGLLACAFAAASAAASSHVASFTLENGMDVVVIEDHRAPVVTHMVWYRVGAADEPPGKSGVAHWLEHLMFKGTDDIPENAFSKIIAENGGDDNAFTSYDYTGYFQRIAADRLELVMEMEADRMRDLVLTEALVLPERDVVIEERNQRTENDPGSLFSEQRSAAQYLNHPYGIPVVGWRSEIEALELEDALEFYERYYAPNNAILIVAGDVTPEEVRRLAEKHYGPLEPSDLPERLRPQEPPQLAERRLTMRDDRVRQPYIVRTYLAPSRVSGGAEKAAALAVFADALGGDQVTSHLGRRLQVERKLAISSGAFYSPNSLDQTEFGVWAVPAPGVTLEELEAALDEELAAFLETGPDAETMDRIRRSVKAAQIYELDSQQSQARRYGAAMALGLRPEDVERWPEQMRAVTAEEALEAGREVLDRRRSVTGWLMGPEGEKS